MKVIVFASGKGGTAKTTTAANIAARLAKKGEKVAMIDMDAQASLTKWWHDRGEPTSPFLDEDADKTATKLRALAAANFAWCIIDTPPKDMKVIEFAIRDADFVVIPVALSMVETDAIPAVVGLCNKWRKRHAYLITKFDKRSTFKKANAEARAALPKAPEFEKPIPTDPKFIEGWGSGKAGGATDATLGKLLDGVIEEIKAAAPKVKGATNG